MYFITDKWIFHIFFETSSRSPFQDTVKILLMCVLNDESASRTFAHYLAQCLQMEICVKI